MLRRKLLDEDDQSDKVTLLWESQPSRAGEGQSFAVTQWRLRTLPGLFVRPSRAREGYSDFRSFLR